MRSSNGAGDDHHPGPMGLQQPEVLELAVDVTLRVTDRDEKVQGGGHRLDAVDDLCEVRVVNLSHKHPHRARIATEESLGLRVGHVVQLTRGLLDACT